MYAFWFCKGGVGFTFCKTSDVLQICKTPSYWINSKSIRNFSKPKKIIVVYPHLVNNKKHWFYLFGFLRFLKWIRICGWILSPGNFSPILQKHLKVILLIFWRGTEKSALWQALKIYMNLNMTICCNMVMFYVRIICLRLIFKGKMSICLWRHLLHILSKLHLISIPILT